jgi:prepilin-type N-terminal cleavage/methylation domain-containing protein
MRRGFSILELSYVLAVMALIAALTVPAYDIFYKRARVDEARSMLAAIADSELRHFRDRGSYLECAAAGQVPKGPVAFPNETACWKSLGIEVTGEVRFRYSVELVEGTFVAVAEGDLDADGVTSRFRWNGRTSVLDVERELE